MAFKDDILTFEDTQIIVDYDYQVMMSWEAPIMEKSAEYICQSKGDILEIGFGMGIERVIENIRRQNISQNQDTERIIMVAHIGNAAKLEAIKLCSQIRSNGGTSLVAPSRGLRSQLRYASHIKATEVVIIGDDEIQSGSFPVRNLGSSEQKNFSKSDILEMFSVS